MAKNYPGEPYTRISTEEAFNKINSEKDSVVVDVRREDEYLSGHVKNSICIPVDEILDRYDELPSEGNLLFICEVGARSGLAAEYASAMGANNDRLFNIEDGTGSWATNGFPISKGKEK